MFRICIIALSLLGMTSTSFALSSEEIDEIFDSLPQAECNEFLFRPCICADQVPETISYRKRFPACGNRAAAILRGQFRGIFSIVLRDKMNNDRVAPEGFNNCTDEEINAGLAKCSAFKVQKIIKYRNRTAYCFGLPGGRLSRATRMTLKLADDPTSNDDPMVRVCLNPNGQRNLNYTPVQDNG